MRLECRRKVIRILMFTFTLVVLTPPCSAQRDLYLVALMGQSNMVGHGELSELPPHFPSNPAKIWNFTNAYKWERAREPIDSPQGQVDVVSLDKSAAVGPALAMADAFVSSHPSISVGLIPCAKGGTSISRWQKIPGAKPRTTLFGSCLNRMKAVSPNGLLRAAIFWQGARDGKTQDRASQWGERFTAFVRDLRNDLGTPNLPVILVMLGSPKGQALVRYPYWEVVRKEQRSVDIPGLIKIEAEGYERKSDGMHFTTTGELAIGADLARLLPAP